jgi:hypothetical protein
MKRAPISISPLMFGTLPLPARQLCTVKHQYANAETFENVNMLADAFAQKSITYALG